MLSQPRLYKIAGIITALVGLWLCIARTASGAKLPFGWWGLIGGVVLLGLGKGMYNLSRDTGRRHMKGN